jgi:uncharacterized membrane protein
LTVGRQLLRWPLPPAIVAIVAAIVIEVHAPGVLRVPASLLFLLLLPGAVWVPLRPQSQRAPFETAALVVATSMGVAVVAGIIINLLPGGLTRTSWTAALLMAVIAGAALSLWRDRGAEPLRWRPGRLSRREVAFSLVNLVVLCGLVAVTAWVSVSSENAWKAKEHFTVLSLNGTSERKLVFGVVDHEGTSVRYRLVATIANKQLLSREVALSSGKSTEIPVDVPVDYAFSDSRLDIQLYRVGRTAVYRSLWLTPHEGKWL